MGLGSTRPIQYRASSLSLYKLDRIELVCSREDLPPSGFVSGGYLRLLPRAISQVPNNKNGNPQISARKEH